MKMVRIRTGAIIATAVLGVIASASFAADQFDFFSSPSKVERETVGTFSEAGLITGGAIAPSTEDILTQLQ